MHILHITEAMGGGVLNVVQQLAARQTDAGLSVTVVHSIRFDTPDAHTLSEMFPDPVRRLIAPMATNVAPYQDIKSIWHLVRLIRKLNPDVIHLHSSKAGVLGRIACRLAGKQKSCFYSPHGFSFLRKDISRSKRALFVFFERVAGRFGGTSIACSQSELQLALNIARHPRAVLVENSMPAGLSGEATGSLGKDFVVSTSGRICFPKNPPAFRDLALTLQNDLVSFLWVGDGELKEQLLLNGSFPDNLKITGWVSRREAVDYLRGSDLFVMTSLWEGMPLALIEAQALGLAAVVPDVEGCKDVVINGVTGFICVDIAQMKSKISLLKADVALRKRMGKEAREQAFKRFSPERMHQELMAAYGMCQVNRAITPSS